VAAADDGVQEISGAMDAQASSVNEVTGAVDDLAGVSQQTTAEATTVASTAEEQAATLRRVSEEAHDLTARARDLRRMTDRFEVVEWAADEVEVGDANHTGDTDRNGAEGVDADDSGFDFSGGVEPDSVSVDVDYADGEGEDPPTIRRYSTKSRKQSK